MHHKVFGLMYSEINIRFFINEATYGTNHSRMDEVKFVEGCLPQILLGPFLNTLSQMLNSYSVRI